jgi:hypothetical protein
VVDKQTIFLQRETSIELAKREVLQSTHFRVSKTALFALARAGGRRSGCLLYMYVDPVFFGEIMDATKLNPNRAATSTVRRDERRNKVVATRGSAWQHAGPRGRRAKN